MKKICLILALLLALCACACAETAAEAPAAITAEELTGLWDLEYVTAEGYMVQAEAYGLVITMTLNADGAVIMDYNGEPDESMSWFLDGGKAYIAGYNPGMDTEILLEDGVLEITDEIGSMFFTRPVQAAEE